jgi:hypothetical protein
MKYNTVRVTIIFVNTLLVSFVILSVKITLATDIILNNQ